jgi:hypothetical protein
MSVIFGLLILLGVFAIILIVLGYFLPTSWMVEKAVLVQANAEEIFPFIETLDNWQEWSVWTSENGINFSNEGETTGLGAVQHWKGQLEAKLIVTKCEATHLLEYRLELEEGKFFVSGTIVLDTSTSEHTQVAWRTTLSVDKSFNPVYRYQSYFLRNYFETTMAESLIGLQALFGVGEVDDPYLG